VAREAADIVLMDDQFPSIVHAIEEGRVIYDNLKKTIAYTLAHAVPEVWPLFLNLVLNFPLGELPVTWARGCVPGGGQQACGPN
jgi:sodium/potassium-transporting ATPase subunit alpha